MRTANPLISGYSTLSGGARYLQSFTLLFFRLAFGWKIYLSGYRHLSHIAATVDNFKEWGIPFPKFNVYVSGSTEMLGGALLMAGLATRLISIPLIFNFIVAMATAGKDEFLQLFRGDDILSRVDKMNYSPGHLSGLESVIDDTAFPFFCAALLLLAFGPGKVSIDYILQRTLFAKPKTSPGQNAPGQSPTMPPSSPYT